MEIEVMHRPSYALGVIRMAPGESVNAETGAMVSMSGGIEIQTGSKGGLMGGLKRSIMGGESFMMNTFTAQSPGELTVAPSLPGDVVHWHLNGEAVFAQSGSYIASAGGLEVDSKWGGAKTFFSGEGLFMLRISGTGDLLISSFGALHQVDLQQGQHYVVDSSHMVAFTEGMNYEVRRVGGWKSTMLSGEGIVVDITGPGRVYLQTRSQQAFIDWLVPQLPTPSN